MIRVPREECIDLDRALGKEWLVTNGLGGYASSTIVGANTRRYHGLLVAALKPPVERTVLLSKVDEEVALEDRTYYLGVNEYPEGKIHPGGFVHLEEFGLREGIPTALYRIGDTVLRKTIWMEHGHNTSYVRYDYAEGSAACRLTLNPMCNYRDYHGLSHGAFGSDFQVEAASGGCRIVAHEGATPYWLWAGPSAEFTPTGVWYWRFSYRREIERGFDETEDLYIPGMFRSTLSPGDSLTLVASTEPPGITLGPAAGALERERARQREVGRTAKIPSRAQEYEASDPAAPVEALEAELVRAADAFMVTREVESDGSARRVPSVIAGYPWFTDWGRDTMISLPGLTLPSRRTAEAVQIVSAFADCEQSGLIPNRFPDLGGEPVYNTADATLWMFDTVATIANGEDMPEHVAALYPVLSRIIAWHVHGTSFGIGMDPADGLLKAGEEGVQLTWMDAKVDDRVITARTGKPVEINALWYRALRVMERLQRSLGSGARAGDEAPPDFAALAGRAAESFRRRFWFAEGGYLYDVIDGPEGDDPSLRPNQVLAISLEGDLVEPERAKAVLKAVREHLVTPCGLRTLSPDDHRYRGRYEGDRNARDAAYHNGTVWPWLLGPYFEAVRRVEGEVAARREFEATTLPAMRAHLREAGLGTISEIFDGDPPHAPRGCIAQAWSVAEILRLVWEARKPV